MAAVEMRSVVTRQRDITAAWLTAALRSANHLADGDVASLSVESWRDKALSNLYRLEATYTGDTPLPTSFILKVGRGDVTSVIATSRRWKEHEFYTRVAPIMADPPVPRPFAAAFDPATRRSHLLLEDLSPTHQNPPAPLPPTPEQLREAVACLAHIHSWWWGHLDLTAATAERDQDWIAQRTSSTRRRLARFMTKFCAHLPQSTRSALEAAASAWPAILRRTATMPLTVVHGDAHPWNFLTPVTPDAGRTCLLDWEGWSIEPGPHDLASLIALHLPVAERQALEHELVERYVVQLRHHGVAEYDHSSCWDDYRLAIVRRVLSPVGLWSRGTPARTWWPALEHMTAAFHDLRCEELI
jgi:aminoglycoside/choline kinase family phosphotransferase